MVALAELIGHALHAASLSQFDVELLWGSAAEVEVYKEVVCVGGTVDAVDGNAGGSNVHFALSYTRAVKHYLQGLLFHAAPPEGGLYLKFAAARRSKDRKAVEEDEERQKGLFHGRGLRFKKFDAKLRWAKAERKFGELKYKRFRMVFH